MPLPNIQTNLPSLIGDHIRDRFYKNQLDIFMQNEYAEYQSELNNLSAALADPSDPDMASKILQSYKASTNKMLVNATRYAKNPYIAQLAQSHFQHDMSQFKNIVDLAGMAQQAAGGGATEKEQAQTELYKEQAATERAKQKKLGVEAEQVRIKAEPANNFWDNWDMSSSAQALGALNRVDSKGLTDRRANEMKEIQLSAAGQIVAQRAATKQINPATQQPWGTGGFDEINQVLGAGEVPPEKVRQLWEMRTLKTDLPAKSGMSEEQIEMMFPQYDWPKRIDTDIIPVGNLPPEQVGALIFSPDGLANIMGGQGIVKNVKEIADRLPNDINALGRGNMVTDLFNAALEANGDNPDTQEPFNNYTEYRNWLIKTGRGVINEKIGGLGVSDAELDPDTKASRQRARALMDMTIDKYAALTARSLRIPKTPDAPTGFFGRLIPHEARKAMEGVTERLFGEETIGAPVSETTPGVKAAAPKRPQAPSSPTLLDVNKVMVQSLPIPDQNRYFRVLQAFMGATDMPGWDAIGPNKKGDLIIKNSKTGKLSLATWDGEIKPVTGLKKKK